MNGDVVFHLGLPKTGTTALQSTLHANPEQLREAGVFYPEPSTHDDPKHQFLVAGLLGGGLHCLESSLAECPEELTPIFSAEGLTNHLFDFPAPLLAEFRSMLSDYRVRGVLVSRPWDAWLKSYFKQCIVNPPSGQWSHYGFSGDIHSFEQHERVRPFRSLSGIVDAVRERLGITMVDVIDYSPNMVPDFFNQLGVGLNIAATVPASNSSLSDVAAEFIRQINGLVEEGPSRRLWVKHVAELDRSSSRIANAVRAGDDFAAMDVRVLDQLAWVSGSGLDVDLIAFERFHARLAQVIRRALNNRPA